ncbi:MAG: hypothetical protein AAGN82_16365 [Myxococcota bacterium]
MLTVAPPPAMAQDTAAAARAFQTAQKAELGEDYSRAAEFYELADSLVPSPEAIRSALRSRMKAGQPAIAAGHAELLLKRYPTDETSRSLAESTLEQVRSSLVAVRVSCGATMCRVLADDEAVGLEKATNHVFFLEPGRHAVTAEFPNGTADPQPVDQPAGGTASLSFETPPPPKPTPGRDERPVTIVVDDDMGGISPWFFATSAAATVGFGIGAIVSGLQANRAGEDFDTLGRTRELFDDANQLEVQTNVLIGVTSGFGVATVILAIFTDWDGTPDASRPPDELSWRLGPGPGEFGLTTEMNF